MLQIVHYRVRALVRWLSTDLSINAALNLTVRGFYHTRAGNQCTDVSAHSGCQRVAAAAQGCVALKATLGGTRMRKPRMATDSSAKQAEVAERTSAFANLCC